MYGETHIAIRIWCPMTVLQNSYSIKRFHNEAIAPPGDYATDPGAFISPEAFDSARREISGWPGYTPTPLLSLGGMAGALGIASLHLKYEAPRFGLGSFKALGGAYAVSLYLRRVIRERTGEDVDTQSLLSGAHADTIKDVVVCSATAGNHGRSVAWGAGMFHCRCVIYVPQATLPGRVDAIAAYGAEVIRHPGNYDETVHQCAIAAAENDWTVVSDTSYEGYTQIPLDVMSGYTVLAQEIFEQLPAGEHPDHVPTHVFVQGGVGGFASGMIAPMWHHWGKDRPKFIFITPGNVPAMLRSAEAGRRVTIEGDYDTVMACLSCGELSLLAWKLLEHSVDDTIAIPDQAAIDTMRTLADGVNGDTPVVAGESGCAGIAGLIAAINDGDAKATLGLDADSRVLCICTEGATDPDAYTDIVGRTPEQVMAS